MRLIKTNLYLAQSHIALDVLSLIAGILLPLAFAPLNYWLLAFISPGLLLLALLDGSHRRAIWRGWLYGFGCFGVGTSWVFVSIHVFGQTNVVLAVILTGLFVSILGLFFALMAYIYSRYFRSKQAWLSYLGFACCWVLSEWLRSWLFTGFPWLLLGNSQLFTVLRHFAPIISVYGISFLVALIAGLGVDIIRARGHRLISLASIIGLLLIGWLLHFATWTQPLGQPLSITLVQGDIPQAVKLDAKQLPTSLNRYAELTAGNWQSLVVWPEGAIPDLYQNHLAYFNRLARQAKQQHSTLIAGTMHYSANRFYSTLASVGQQPGFYFKRHLVPFGEYFPLPNFLRKVVNFFDLPISIFTPGPAIQPLLQAGQVKIGSFLCYEIAYMNLVLRDVPAANILLTASNDSWFGKSWAAAQQLQLSQMRSLETGRAQAVVANDGYTAFINTKGQIIKRAPRGQIYVLKGQIQPRTGSTPLVAIGWQSAFWLLVLLSGLVLALGWRDRY